MRAISPADYQHIAKGRLPRFLFDYLEGGANSETTLLRNISELRSVKLPQRVLTGTGDVDLTVEVLGQRWAMPVALGPIGLAGMYAKRGEVQAARAARKAGLPYTLSTVSICPIQEVGRRAENLWFQLYMIRDRGFMRALLSEAQSAGCSTLVFTVDMPVAGVRYRDYRSGLAGSPGATGQLRRAAQALLRPSWAWNVGVRGRPHHLGNVAPVLAGKTGLEDFFGWMQANFDPNVTWRDLEEVRALWNGPLIVKGILDAEDARAALNAGADGIVVSNHGGRQLDGVASTAQALPAIADAVGDELVVLADGGVRSGIDVLRMLSLGAKGVLLGRLWVYALAAGGEAAVTQMLHLLEKELRTGMMLSGLTK